MENIQTIVKDFPTGPLDIYRKQASFDWKKLALILDNEDRIKFKHDIWNAMENDSLFEQSLHETESLEELRNLTLERALKLFQLIPDTGLDIRTRLELSAILGQYDWSVSIRYAALTAFFTNAVRGLGTSKHEKYIEAADNTNLFGTTCITEIGHGTNLKGLQTRATFDSARQKFILHTPNFQAAKCWAANLAKTANYAYVMAQLYTPDGICHGLHAFVVPIRDTQFNVLPGVIIGDMGPKAGLNGVDNGFMMFDNYVIPKESLLDKNGSVMDDGSYVSPFKDPNKKFGASFGNLSMARVVIVNLCSATLSNAITIAIRYSAVRRQFGSQSGSDELPILEYQLQQCRLFPHLSAAYVMKYFISNLLDNTLEFRLKQMNSDSPMDPEVIALWGMEMHAISCAAKPIAGWLTQDAIQDCREACGGHGYLKAAGLGRLRDDNDAFLTFEGVNEVLMQQTSNWLINIWHDSLRENVIKKSKLQSINFLRKADQRLKKKFQSGNLKYLTTNPKIILQIYKWLVCYLLRSTSEKFRILKTQEGDTFSARNNSQVFLAKTLSLAYIEHFMIETFYNFCNQPELAEEIRAVLKKILMLYGLWSLEKLHLGTLYEGGYFSGPLPSKKIRDGILQLCNNLKPEAVALVDVLAPSDFALNSVLGSSDGQVYKRLEQSMSTYPASFQKPTKWSHFSSYLKAKL